MVNKSSHFSNKPLKDGSSECDVTVQGRRSRAGQPCFCWTRRRVEPGADITVLGPRDLRVPLDGVLSLSLGQEHMGMKIPKGQRKDWAG